ncbi:urocanate hydratase [Saprolegnia diclina VS20]|uniref:urocanate hydratase n=1 Tax=Saprolegnia diclina (strain VS20) TaxID=1156394 RepID=T0PSD3_SAPDV|nr:urocanate hydratase [Saprolegnia diclina VS20]EQC25151.1 urocanate hydratase [Saprolegnia diclina VS20]|eukprot:XP_008621433.1 urocanate hydratase [Saprolegnia diclina VS20]
MTNPTVLQVLTRGLGQTLPAHPGKDLTVPQAPVRTPNLTERETRLAIKNALRYFPSAWHATLAPEFAQELKDEGHIYMYRFRPTEYEMKGYPVDWYPAKTTSAKAIMMMIMNNLDKAIAQFPAHLITYGGNGSVFSNWAQYLLVMKYLSEMTEDQTLVLYSGHPAGLFPSSPDAPRMIVTNGMMIPNYSTREMYDKLYAMGNTQYGQMTAGSYCYIGPQGIVHGTTITVMNAARKYLGKESMKGVVYVSSGLGGMSGAQPKAGVIAGMISVTAEVDYAAIEKRHAQGWVNEIATTLPQCLDMIRSARKDQRVVSIAYHGNVVDLWEALADAADAGEHLVDLGSDQTSLHNPYNGGYYPVQLSFDDALKMMASDPAHFKELVQSSLLRHVSAINRLTAKGMYFWDYGNSFLLEASRAGADIYKSDDLEDGFKYPSYVQDIMGDIFSLGFGPFRWVCTSGDEADLLKTDAIAGRILNEYLATAPPLVAAQLRDNIRWIEAADENKMVVGTQARILYADRHARASIAIALNQAIASGELSAPVVLSRDHHDVSGTDSPFRETSNVTDGSMFCADMAIHNVIGDAARGATWVSIHNGGGCGWGQVMNGGFGHVLDGSQAAERKAASMLRWDVNNGVSRRAWGRNDNACFAIAREMEVDPLLTVTMPQAADDDLIKRVCDATFQ